MGRLLGERGGGKGYVGPLSKYRGTWPPCPPSSYAYDTMNWLLNLRGAAVV